MPKPNPSEETRAEWMKRCIPALINEGREQDQAVAICSDMWARAKKSEFKGVLFKNKDGKPTS